MGVKLPTPEEMANLMRNLAREAQHTVVKEATEEIAPLTPDEVEEVKSELHQLQAEDDKDADLTQSDPVLQQEPAVKNFTQTAPSKHKRR